MRTLLVAIALALGVYGLAVAGLAVAGRRTGAKEVAAFLPNLARLFKGLIGDSRVPRSSKVFLVLGAVWIASPIAPFRHGWCTGVGRASRTACAVLLTA